MLKKETYDRLVEANLAENQVVIARANELLAGSPLRFDQSELESALEAFYEFKKISYRFRGDTRDFLQKTGINTLFGRAYCRSCGEQTFSSDREYAKHMMSFEHFLGRMKTTREAVNEVRAHLHAYPVDPDLMGEDSIYKIFEVYRFVNVPE
jgi:hypothetical protein